jgi:phage protein D
VAKVIDDAAPAVEGGVGAVPRPVFRLVYGQKDITNDITEYVTSVTYADHLSGQSDEIEVALEDADGRWVDSWYPGKGDTLALAMGFDNGPMLACGQFEIDEIEFADPPSTVLIRALGSWPGKPVRTRNSIGMEKTTMAAVAAHIAKRNGFTLTGKIKAISIDRVTQNQETDVAFLTRLADEYGYAFKVMGRRLVFTEIAALLKADPAAYFSLNDLVGIRITDKITHVYKDAKVKYHDAKAKKLVVCGTKADGQVGVAGASTSSDTLKKTTRAPDKATAQTKAEAGLKKANLEQTTGSITVPGNTALVAGLMVGLEAMGKLGGKYLIKSARHQIDRSGGYTSELEIARESPQARPSASSAAAKGKKKSSGPGQLKVYGLNKEGNVDVVGSTAKKR